MEHHYSVIMGSRICYMANIPFLFVVALSAPLSVLLSSFVVALTLRSVATINSVYRKLRRDILQEPNYVQLPSRKFSHGVNISIKVTHIVRVHLQTELRKYEINEQPWKFPFKNSKIKSTYELTLYQSLNIIAIRFMEMYTTTVRNTFEK